MVNSDYVVKQEISSGRLVAGHPARLFHLDIELTERCNNACRHCYINLPANDTREKAQELTTEQWKDIIRQAADLGVLSIRFTGGEPLLREDFKEIYLHTRKLGIKVLLYTNARLITPALVNLLAEVPPLKEIEVSSYGLHRDSYKAVTGTEGYEEFRNGIQLLLENGIPFVVKSVLLPMLNNERQELETWVKKIPWMKRQSPGYSLTLSLRTRRDSSAKNRMIASLRSSPEEIVAFFSKTGQEYRAGMAQFAEKFMYPQGDHLFSCEAGISGCVDSYGNYQMCMLLRHPETIYNLRHGNLREGLTKAFPKYRETRATNPEYLQRCARCFIKGLCEQCPGKSWSEYGTLDTPVEYLCQVAHAQAIFLGLLNENEKAWEVTKWQERINGFVQKPEG